MMKKLMFLMMVLGTASAALATPLFVVDQSDYKDHYTPSEIITINLVESEGGVTGMMIDAIGDGGMGGVASDPQVFAEGFGSIFPGSLNEEGQLVIWMAGYSVTVPPTPQSGVLYSFDYHVPDVQTSTIINIGSLADADWVSEVYYLDGSTYADAIGGLAIHVIPEPATMALLGLGGLLLRRRGK